MLAAPCTSTGTSERPMVLLMPSLPKPSAPHVHTVPSDLRMSVPLAPPQRETTSAETAAKGIGKVSIQRALIPIENALAFCQASMFPSCISGTVAGCIPIEDCEAYEK